MTSAPARATSGPTSLAETARLTGEFSDWHNVLHRVTWVTGSLDIVAVRDAWRGVCLRHDVMRRIFLSADEARTFSSALSEVEFCVAATDAEAIETMQRTLGKPFDLYGPGLSRIVVVQCNEQRYLLGIALDHIISDEVSWARLHRDFAELYERALSGDIADTAERTTYRSFATQQRRMLSSSWGDRRRAFWQKYTDEFGTFPPSFSLDARHTGEVSMKVLERELPADARAKVHRLSLRARATPFTVITTSVLAGMLEATGDSLAGITVNQHGRVLPGTSETLGLFVQTVPLHLRRTSGTPIEIVRDIFAQRLDVFEYSVPLRVAGNSWDLDLVSSSTEAGVYVGLNGGGPNFPALAGTVTEDVAFRIPGEKLTPETILVDWQLYGASPRIVASYNQSMFSTATVEQLLSTAEEFALSEAD